MAWLFIAIGLISVTGGVWTAGIEGFRTFEDRQKASDPNEATQITYSFEMVAHDGSRYRVVAYREGADAAVGKALVGLLIGSRKR